MFYFITQRAKIFLVLFAALLFIGCPEPDDEDAGALNGVWINDAAGYTTTIKIDTSEKTVEYVDSYEGKIVNSPDFSAANGVLIIEFTKYIEWDYTNYPDVTSAENPDNVGKYGAIYWKDLTIDQVYMADAYTGYTHTMFNTLSEASTNFTLDNSGNYIDWSIVGSYTK